MSAIDFCVYTSEEVEKIGRRLLFEIAQKDKWIRTTKHMGADLDGIGDWDAVEFESKEFGLKLRVYLEMNWPPCRLSLWFDRKQFVCNDEVVKKSKTLQQLVELALEEYHSCMSELEARKVRAGKAEKNMVETENSRYAQKLLDRLTRPVPK